MRPFRGLLIFIVIFMFSCHPADERIKSPDGNYGDTIIFASIGDASFLNPVLATDTSSSSINELVFNGLTKYNKDIILEGDLAERWEVSKDGLQIKFYLRKDVKWHDGMPFTSKDVKFTYDSLVNPMTKTPFSSDFLLISDFSIIDDFTIMLTYKEPFAPALESWGMGILPEHVYRNGEFNTHPANRKPVGTGPYKFVEWKTDQKIVLEANPAYFKGRPHISRVIYRIVPDQSVQFLELQKENIDFTGLTPEQYLRTLEDETFSSRFNVFRYPSFSFNYIGYNLKNELFSDVRVRRALAFAINKNDIINGALQGMGQAITGPFPPSSWAYDHQVEDFEYNPEKAAGILNSLGWKDSDSDGIIDKDGKPFKFTIITNQGNKMRALTGEIIQANLKKIGIKVELRILEWSSFLHQYIDKKKFEAVVLSWSLSRDPDQFSIWHSSQQGDGMYNFVSYSNSRIDKLLVQGRQTFKREARKKIYHEIHRILFEDQPYCFLYVAEALPVLHKRFKGAAVAPAGIKYNFIDWYVDKGEEKYEM